MSKKILPISEVHATLENLAIVFSKKYTKLVKVKKNKSKTVFKLDGVWSEQEIIEKYINSLEE